MPNRRGPAGRRALAAVVAMAGLALVAAGGEHFLGRDDRPAVAVAAPNWGDPSTPPPGRPDSMPGSVTSSRATPPAHMQRAARLPHGSRLVLSRLRLDAPIVRVSARDGVMTVPRDPHTVGWWEQGVPPGAEQGSAVIVGHVNYAGVRGVLDSLTRTRPGDLVVITEHGRRLRYAVTAVRSYPKSSGIPADVFRRTGAPRLVLITCGGPFDPATGNYLDNIVAYADAVGPS